MPRPGPLSLNTVTVKERWGLAECIEGCARHGIPGISPWRDVLAAMGVQRAARRIRSPFAPCLRSTILRSRTV